MEYMTTEHPRVKHIAVNGDTLCGENTNFMIRIIVGQRNYELPICLKCLKILPRHASKEEKV